MTTDAAMTDLSRSVRWPWPGDHGGHRRTQTGVLEVRYEHLRSRQKSPIHATIVLRGCFKLRLASDRHSPKKRERLGLAASPVASSAPSCASSSTTSTSRRLATTCCCLAFLFLDPRAVVSGGP